MWRWLVAVAVLATAFVGPARAEFPFAANANRCDTSAMPLGCIPLPNEMSGAPGACNGLKWKYASTNFCSTDLLVNASANELFGVTGMSVDTAWRTQTGRSDVVVAVHDSGFITSIGLRVRRDGSYKLSVRGRDAELSTFDGSGNRTIQVRLEIGNDQVAANLPFRRVGRDLRYP